MSERFAGRSAHGAPLHARRFAANPVLTVTGDVERSLSIGPRDLADVGRISFRRDIAPDRRAGWPETDWSGVSVATLIERAGSMPDVAWIQILGGPLGTVLPITAARDSFLADRINGEPIPVEFGGPYRLIYPSVTYSLCVKWVDRIMVTVEEPDRSVERVAASRQRARDARGIR